MTATAHIVRFPADPAHRGAIDTFEIVWRGEACEARAQVLYRSYGSAAAMARSCGAVDIVDAGDVP